MIGRLSGKIIEKQPPQLLLEVAGVGYEIQASMTTFYDLPELEQSVSLHTHLVVREDAHILYGFSSQQERLFFKTLIKINGVGPKLALTILSGISSNEFVVAVQNDDVTRLVRLPGIGKKTAERLIVEMRDRITQWLADGNSCDIVVGQSEQNSAANALNGVNNNPVQEAISALESLGYKPADARKMISALNKENQNSEQLIKLALKNSIG
ncbi:MAG: Holliday junction branch migration protein RuvA [Pseudomonadota bacterium]